MSYKCSACDATMLKWAGVCSNCNEWDTLEEFASTNKKTGSSLSGKKGFKTVAKSLSRVKKSGANTRMDRVSCGIDELDRVLGGGFVGGEVVVLGGRPGIGKSTLLTQVASVSAKKGKVLYVSGEESSTQLLSRFDRLNGEESDILDLIDVTEENRVEALAELIDTNEYSLVIVDSIQSVKSVDVGGFPGGIAQVRNAGGFLVNLAKKTGVPFVLVGQINKDGVIAGPKVLEHIVDCVLYLEGDDNGAYRILSCVKNRFGATDEIGVFEMTESGLIVVENPSQVFLGKDTGSVGSVVTAVLRGSRVVLMEVQALVVERSGGAGPMRRVANGIKGQRLEMLAAVMSRFGKLRLGDKDIFVNVVGGFTVTDTSIDLAICEAIRSSYSDKQVAEGSVYLGEVGLTGGVRAFYGLKRVVKELGRLGYKVVYSPNVDISSKKIKSHSVNRISDL
jgi:DNA repair protein RadA/Sms